MIDNKVSRMTGLARLTGGTGGIKSNINNTGTNSGSSIGNSSMNYKNDADIVNRLLPDNYIYISHLDEGLKFWRIPEYPDTIADNMSSTFTPTNALGRSAPVYTFSNAGPRTVQVHISLHRDIMDDINETYSNSKLQGLGEDYVDNLINALRAAALPKYNLENKLVEPPLIALRLGRELFVKGILTSGIGLNFEKPILSNERYAWVTLSLIIAEVDPYDASTVYTNGGFRGEVSTMRTGALINSGVMPRG